MSTLIVVREFNMVDVILVLINQQSKILDQHYGIPTIS
jgi:hypothetical protein